MKPTVKIALTLSCLVIAMSSFDGCSGSKDGGKAAADEMKATLSGFSREGKVAYAHQDDLVYGHTWKVTDIVNDPLDRSDVKSVCGDFPYMVGFDLGGIELGDPNNLDGVPFDLMRRAAVAQTERGGMVTFSWHPRNPYTGGDAWDISSDKVVESILEGGEKHSGFMEWLRRAGDFLESLTDAKGNPIPVIFRPWHENVGSWFWWGGKLCTADQYKDLFRLTVEYLRDERGLQNIVWAYSPNSGISYEEYMERYPGNEYVDVVGTDHYEYVDTNAEISQEQRFASANGYYQMVLRQELDKLKKISSENGKIMVLSETGMEGIPYKEWWTGVLLPVLREYPVAYVLTWRNAHDRAEHFYAPFPGSGDSEDFKAFHDDPATVFLQEKK